MVMTHHLLQQAERFAFGNLLKLIERPKSGSGEIRRIVTDYTYYMPGNRMKSQRGPYYTDASLKALPNEKIGEMNYDYDSNRNLITIRSGNVLLPDKKVQTLTIVKFLYNPYGLCTDSFIETLHVQYIYFPDEQRSGFVKELIEDCEGFKRHLYYEVDTLGRTKQVRGHYGDVTDIEWTTFDAPKRIIEPEIVAGKARPSTHYKYNRNRQVVEIKEELKLHDGNPHPQNSLIKKYRYDTYGRLIEQRLGPLAAPDSRIQKTTFTPFNFPEKKIDFLQNVTFTKYNERMLISSITRGWGTPDNATVKILYDITANPVEFINGRKFKTVIEYDAFNRQHIIRDPDGNESESEYDATGRVTRTRLYGLHPRTKKKVRWSEVDFHYDAAGRFIEKIDHLFIPGGTESDTLLTTQLFYDPLNRIETVVYPNGSKLHYVYDGRIHLKSSIDSDGNERTWRYDDVSHKVTIVDKDVGKDRSGKLVTQIFQNVTEFDGRNLPIREVDSLGNIRRWEFDSRKLLSYYEDANLHKFFSDYDVYGQQVFSRTHLDGHGIRTQMHYDDNGNIVSLISPTRGQTIWTYDALNRIIRIDRNGTFTAYEYDEQDNVIYQNNSNGISITNFYTPADRLKTRRPNTDKFSPPLESLSYVPSPTSTSEFVYTPDGKIAFAINEIDKLEREYDSLAHVRNEKTNKSSVSYQYNHRSQITGLTLTNGRNIVFDYSLAGYLKEVSQTSFGSNYPGDRSLGSSRILTSIWRIGGRPLTIMFGSSYFADFQYDAGKRIAAIDWIRTSDKKSLLHERNYLERMENGKFISLILHCGYSNTMD